MMTKSAARANRFSAAGVAALAVIFGVAPAFALTFAQGSANPYGEIESPLDGQTPSPSQSPSQSSSPAPSQPPASAPAGGMGPLSQYLPASGNGAVWAYENTGATFRVANENDPSSIDYVYVGALDGADRRIEARLDLTGGAPEGFAGLLLGFDEASRNYHIFALSPDGAVSVFRRDEEGFRPIIQSTSEAVRPGENQLVVEERGDDLRFLVNGEKIVELGVAGLGQGDVGVAAGGLVDATYTAFDVRPLNP